MSVTSGRQARIEDVHAVARGLQDAWLSRASARRAAGRLSEHGPG